jgi:hypothetical protein
MNDCTIKQNHLKSFYIEHPHKPYLAWSTDHWVPHWKGLATKHQISHFPTAQEAIEYAQAQGLNVE